MEGEAQQTADEAEVFQVEGVDITEGTRVVAEAGGLQQAMTRVRQQGAHQSEKLPSDRQTDR